MLSLTNHTPLEIIIIVIIHSYIDHTRIIILPMVVTIFASQVCSAPSLQFEREVIARGRTFSCTVSSVRRI